MPYPTMSWLIVAVGVAFLALMAPVSMAYDRTYRATIAEYAELRRSAGAPEAEWPDASLRREIFVSPVLLMMFATLSAVLSAFGAMDEYLRADPFGWLPGFVPEPRLSALLPAIGLGIVATVVLVALALRGFWSPWWPVQVRLRRAAMLKGAKRAALLAETLGFDPSVPEAVS